MTRDRRSERVPTITWEVRSLFLPFLLRFVFLKEKEKSQFLSFIIDKICKSPSMAKSPSTAQNRLSRQTKQNCLSWHLKSCLFLGIYMQWKDKKKVWFPFYLWRWISGSPFQIPSRIENLAYPYKKKCWCLLFYFSSPRRTPADPGRRKARKKKTGPSSCHTQWDLFIWEHDA